MICGYTDSYNDTLSIESLLSGCHPVVPPRSSAVTVDTVGTMSLGATGDGCFYKSADNRYCCLVHGNIYPTQAILDLADQEGTSSMPARLLLALYRIQGIESFRDLPGSFVFAIWDSVERKLTLGRDRFGGKRIYYALTHQGFIFASSLGSIARLPAFDRSISMNGFIEYMSYGFAIPPNTIYEHISTLNPGEYLIYDGNKITAGCFHPLTPPEWKIQDTSNTRMKDLVDRLEALLIDSVMRRLPAESDIAVYLSGGLDTPLICSLLKQLTDKRITAFTLASMDKRCNEAPYARQVAKYLNVYDHQGYYIQKKDFLEGLYALPKIYGQPFADISAIPNYTITRNVSRDFGAVFGGDGPDFKYGGIDFRIWQRYYNYVPYLLRIPFSKILTAIFNIFYRKWSSPNIHISELLSQPEFFWIFHKKFKSRELERITRRTVDPSMFWIRNYLETRTDIPAYERLRHAFFIVFGTHGVFYKGTAIHDALDIKFITPYFDPEMFDFVQSLPTKYKFRDGRGKFLHKQLLFRHVPRKLFERPKRGFIINYSEFGLEFLRGLTDEHLTREKLGETGLIDTDFALQCINRYFHGDARMGPYLWTLLTFQIWREEFSL